MARTKSVEHAVDPATGRRLPAGVAYRGPFQYRARKLVIGVRVTKTFELAKAAGQWLEETSVAVRKGEFVDRRSLEHWTVAELVQRFVAEELQCDGMRRGAAEDLGHIPALLGDDIGRLKLSQLTRAAVRGFRDRQQKVGGFAPATIVKRLNLLAAIINHARAEWDIPMAENPASAGAVTRPKGADKKRNRRLVPVPHSKVREAEEKGEVAPKGEEERLHAALTMSQNRWDVWLAKWAIAQAMRQGETFALRWQDIDFDAKTVTVHGRHRRGTKNHEHREEQGPEIRPLMPEAIAILQAIAPEKGAKPTDQVFPAGDQKAFAVRFGRIVARADLPDLTYHDLRHEATSWLAKRFPNPLDLKRVTGHRDLKSLDRYYKPDMTELAEQGARHLLGETTGQQMGSHPATADSASG